MSALHDVLSNLPDAVLVNLLGSETAYLLVLDLPGVTAETAKLRIEKDRLVVGARHDKQSSAKLDYVREERPLFLDAKVPPSPDVVVDETEVSMERGILGIRFPKHETAFERIVPITTGDEDA